MSIELRMVCDRPDNCTFYKVLPIGSDRCTHHLECDWGRFNNSEADPRRDIEHLMLIRQQDFADLAATGQYLDWRGSIGRAAIDGQRLFFHLDYHEKHWTWELFEAHWWDHDGPAIYVGRWPD